jgi:DNA-nicking Smr family endonuclease
VVTGKGLAHGGVLRHMVPRWLNEAPNRERVLAFAPAQPKHGGGGALYILIRRKR